MLHKSAIAARHGARSLSPASSTGRAHARAWRCARGRTMVPIMLGEVVAARDHGRAPAACSPHAGLAARPGALPRPVRHDQPTHDRLVRSTEVKQDGHRPAADARFRRGQSEKRMRGRIHPPENHPVQPGASSISHPHQSNCHHQRAEYPAGTAARTTAFGCATISSEWSDVVEQVSAFWSRRYACTGPCQCAAHTVLLRHPAVAAPPSLLCLCTANLDEVGCTKQEPVVRDWSRGRLW